MANNLLVIGEVKDNIIRNVTFEAIGAAKKIEPSGNIVGVLCGAIDLHDQAQEMIYHGADKVYTVTHNNLEHYTSEGYSQAIMPIIKEINPQAIVMGHTATGKDLTPKIAGMLDVGLISDITEIVMQENRIVYTRPIYSGKAFENKIMNNSIQFVTIRPNNIAALPKNDSRNGEIIEKEIAINHLHIMTKDVLRKSSTSNSKGVDMSEANIVVAGGRGVKSADWFKSLYELADVLGGAVGATRGACDANYCDYSLQIGQTGKVVTPDLYIAVGISGAIQHVAGMSNSKVIVAINKDPDATIFSIADYSIVGDLLDVIPVLIDEIKKIKQL